MNLDDDENFHNEEIFNVDLVYNLVVMRRREISLRELSV